MASSEYWAERFEQLEEAQINKGEAFYNELERQYLTALRKIQSDIDEWFLRFADNEEVTLAQARKLLDKRELEEFKWDVEEYIRRGEENNITGQWARQLENASARVHISRLEAIQTQIQSELEILFAGYREDLEMYLEDLYKDSYYHTAYEIEKGVGIGRNINALSTEDVETIVSKPWASDGSNFSDRIWTQRTKLVTELQTNLAQALIMGKSAKTVSDEIAKRMGVSQKQAGRLVMTETAFFAEKSSHDCFKFLGVEEYRILATLDNHTSEICRKLDGRVFKMSEWNIGVTAPPFHVWCRTTTVPNDDEEFLSEMKRIARDENGDQYYVPANMTYKEWYKKFVKGDGK